MCVECIGREPPVCVFGRGATISRTAECIITREQCTNNSGKVRILRWRRPPARWLCAVHRPMWPRYADSCEVVSRVLVSRRISRVQPSPQRVGGCIERGVSYSDAAFPHLDLSLETTNPAPKLKVPTLGTITVPGGKKQRGNEPPHHPTVLKKKKERALNEYHHHIPPTI
jgi:hypothetical protein